MNRSVTSKGAIALAFMAITVVVQTIYLFRHIQGKNTNITLNSNNTGGWYPEANPRIERSAKVSLLPCPPFDPKPMASGLQCIEKCEPPAFNVLQDPGSDPYGETVNITMAVVPQFGTVEFTKHHVHFMEEGVTLNLTGKLVSEMNTAMRKAKDEGKTAINDAGYLQPRPITERLMRRIVAKLLRTGVLDPSKSIVNTGSWIGDNALPWALMLEKLRPDYPGKIIAIDPSARFIQDMVDLAHVNAIGNVCFGVGILSANNSKVGIRGHNLQHVEVKTEDDIKSRPRMRKILNWWNTTTLDSLNLQNVSLLHLDVEGHEGELLKGAITTIQSSRPVIITEGYDTWPNPTDANDRQVLKILTELGYKDANTIPEFCGLKRQARNRIWWPDEQTKAAAMAIVGIEFQRPLVPWMSKELLD